MSLPDALAALRPVVDELERLGVVYYLGGSLASSAYGIARATLDADLVAELRPPPCHSAGRGPAERVLHQYENDLRGNRPRSCFNLIHLPTMFKVDIFVPKDRPYDREALRRIHSDSIEQETGALRCNLASAEDVILNKLEWFRLGEEISHRQWNDVLGV